MALLRVAAMIRPSLFLAAAAAALAASPAAARPMTARDVQSMHRLSEPAVSPDGRYVAYSLTETDWKSNKRRTDLFVLDLTAPAAPPLRLVNSPDTNESSPAFSSDGQWIYFLSNKSGSEQVWRIRRGQKAEQVTDLKADVGGFLLSPNNARMAVWADRDLRCTDFNCAGLPSKPESGSGRTYDQLFVRHWDSWAEAGVRSRIFTFPMVEGKPRGGGVPVTGNLVGDTPGKPFGGAEELAFSPDGQTLYFTLREAGRIEAKSTNLDIFAVPSDGSRPPVNLTDANDATDTLPAVSPDGRTLAYVAMARPTYEADRQVLQLRDIASGRTRAVTARWDRSIDSVEWSKDGRSILVTAGDTLEEPVFRVDAATGEVARLTGDGHFGNVRALPGGGLLATMNSIQAPDDIYRIDAGGRVAQLTNVNRELLAQMDPVGFRKFSFNGANNDRVWGWTLVPVRNRMLPTLLLVHGGPQGSFSNSWSYRWNPRVFASPGYGVVSIDFHGSTGYGQRFTDSINRNWGGWPLEDLKRGMAYVAATNPQLDTANACAAGGSYGGYMMNWIEGQWPDRFKCIVQHDGVFDARAMAYETEELWFDEWEHGGHAYYEAPAEFERWNPVNYVRNWRTPQLVITSEKDFRIPYTQGIAAFTALQRRGVPSRLLIFPDENHWVLKPKNSVQWYDEVFGWFGKYLGPNAMPKPAANPVPTRSKPEKPDEAERTRPPSAN